ncbi:MAG: hypothetical protein ACREHG_09820 [Candidatus Saccharimonadales bacterium]
MSNSQEKSNMDSLLLDEIETALKHATPEQISTSLKMAGLKKRADENKRLLRRAMSVDYSADMTPPVTLRKAALTGFDFDNAGTSRIRLRFALAAKPALAKKLGVTLDEISELTDDAIVSYFHKLQEFKS